MEGSGREVKIDEKLKDRLGRWAKDSKNGVRR